MRHFWKIAGPVVLAGIVLSGFAQRAFRQYPSVEYGEAVPLPSDWNRPAEWTFARLMFPPGPLDGYAGRFDGPWQEGLSLWTQDYPRADRALANAVDTFRPDQIVIATLPPEQSVWHRFDVVDRARSDHLAAQRQLLDRLGRQDGRHLDGDRHLELYERHDVALLHRSDARRDPIP